MSSCRLMLSFLLATSWLNVLAAVGPVMNQQQTVFDVIQSDPDLSEVRKFLIFF